MHGRITVMSAHRRHPEELRERTTRMAVEARRGPQRPKGATRRIADELAPGIHPEALRAWVTKAPRIDGGARPVTTTSDAERIRRFEADKPRAVQGERDPEGACQLFLAAGARPPVPLICEKHRLP